MERKIGEIFEFGGEWYQCIKGVGCGKCDLRNIICRRDTSTFPFKACSGNFRTDNKSVIFKKLEKVGGTYAHNSVIVQKYRIRATPVIMQNEPHMYFNAIDNTIAIELKQNKEDMEEKKIQHYDFFFDKKKSNLKPFDIQKAREGKPVCTRDGHKARIICFDAKSSKPIIALITRKYDDYEEFYSFYENGRACSDKNNDYDLMMLPEKKEGWVNIYEFTKSERLIGNIFSTREEAMMSVDADKVKSYITTIKIEWGE